MSDYLLAHYRPIAAALLKQHDLIIDGEARDMLAKTVMMSREVLRNDSSRQRSPTPSARKALAHARRLLQYLENPPRRKDSVPKRCAKLRSVLLDGSDLPAYLGFRLAGAEAAFDYDALLESLSSCLLDPERLLALIHALEPETDPKGRQEAGRPRGPAWSIVRAGCMVWRVSGRARLSYRWNDVENALTGPLADFLRALLGCCNGTHPLSLTSAREIQGRLTRQYLGNSAAKPRGDSLRLSAGSLKLAIIECQKDAELQKYLHQRAQKPRTYFT